MSSNFFIFLPRVSNMKPYLGQVDVDNVVIASLYTITFLNVLSLIVDALLFILSFSELHSLLLAQSEFPLPANDSIKIRYSKTSISDSSNIIEYLILNVVLRQMNLNIS